MKVLATARSYAQASSSGTSNLILETTFALRNNITGLPVTGMVDFDILDNTTGEVLISMRNYVVQGDTTFNHVVPENDYNHFSLHCNKNDDDPSNDIDIEFEYTPYMENCISISGNLGDEGTNMLISTIQVEDIEGRDDLQVILSDGSIITYDLQKTSFVGVQLVPYNSEFQMEGTIPIKGDFTVVFNFGNNKVVSLDFQSAIVSPENVCTVDYINTPDVDSISLTSLLITANTFRRLPELSILNLTAPEHVKTLPFGLFDFISETLPSVDEYIADPKKYLRRSEGFYSPIQIYVAGNFSSVPEQFLKGFGAHLATQLVKINLSSGEELTLPSDIFDYVNYDAKLDKYIGDLVHMENLPEFSMPIKFDDGILKKVGSLGSTQMFRELSEIPEKLFANTIIRSNHISSSMFSSGTFTSIPESIFDATKASVTDDPDYIFPGDYNTDSEGVPINMAHPAVLIKNSINTPMQVGQMFMWCNITTIPADLFKGLYLKCKRTTWDSDNKPVYVDYSASGYFANCKQLEGTVEEYMEVVKQAKSYDEPCRAFKGCEKLADYEEAQTTYPDWV